jgi:hypothetical protein
MLTQLEKDYGYLWNGSEQDWVLVKSAELPGHYTIFNDRTSTALCIEDGEVQTAVCRRMQDAGCKVIEHITPRSAVVRPLDPSE